MGIKPSGCYFNLNQYYSTSTVFSCNSWKIPFNRSSSSTLQLLSKLPNMATSSTTAHIVIAGGIPDHTDVVLSGIFVALFFSIGVYFHFRTFQAYGKKFIWSGLCFSYSIARIVALSLRIAGVQVRFSSTRLTIKADGVIRTQPIKS